MTETKEEPDTGLVSPEVETKEDPDKEPEADTPPEPIEIKALDGPQIDAEGSDRDFWYDQTGRRVLGRYAPVSFKATKMQYNQWRVDEVVVRQVFPPNTITPIYLLVYPAGAMVPDRDIIRLGISTETVQ